MRRPPGIVSFIAACAVLTAFSAAVRAADDPPISRADEAARAAVGPTAEEDLVVTATRTQKRAHETPSTVHVLDEDVLVRERMARTLPEALEETPGVMVQKTGPGQGSPFIRGFTGFRTLLLVDGIRLNSSVMRDGPNQYWGTVDPYTISRLEAVLAPGSVLFGSDAIGGTVNVLTRSADRFGERRAAGGALFVRGSTAEHSLWGRVEAEVTHEDDVGLLVGITRRDFGDLDAGEPTGLQPGTGYEDAAGDFKLDWYLRPDVVLTVAHQAFRQRDAPRTHRTVDGVSFAGTSIGSEKVRELDQARDLSYVQVRAVDLEGPISAWQGSLSYHVQEEDRLRVRADDRSDRQGFDVRTLGAWFQLESDTRAGHWTYGLEYYRDQVDSFRTDFHADGSVRRVRVQGPVADDATYEILGLFAQDEIDVGSRLSLVLGARATWVDLQADRVADPATGDAFAFSDDWSSVVGSVRGTVRLGEGDAARLFFGVGQGFRAPNLSDTTRFDSARSDEIETPAPGLEPEDFVTYEAGLKVRTSRVRAQVSGYYTDMSDVIVRTPTGMIIDGESEVTKKNAGEGWVRGLDVDWAVDPAERWTIFGSLSFIDGELSTFPTSDPVLVREPLDRLPPTMGRLGVRWSLAEEEVWLEALLTAAAAQDELSTRDAADTQRIPPGGTPSWWTFSVRGGWQIREGLTLTASLENLFDEDYRVHGSGQNESGRSLLVGVHWVY